MSLENFIDQNLLVFFIAKGLQLQATFIPLQTRTETHVIRANLNLLFQLFDMQHILFGFGDSLVSLGCWIHKHKLRDVSCIY